MMNLNSQFLFVLLLFKAVGFNPTESKITGTSAGKFYLGMPLDEFINQSKNFRKEFNEEYGYLLYEKEELVLRIWSKDQKKVSGISVYSPKLMMDNGLKVGSRTEEILEKVKDYSLEINSLDTQEEYILPIKLNRFDPELNDKIIFKLIVKPIKGKYVGDYKTFQPDEKVRKIRNKGILKAIEMHTYN